MALIYLKCKNCGGDISYDNDKKIGFCPFCGSKVIETQEIINNNNYVTNKIEHANINIDTNNLEQTISNAETFLSIHHNYSESLKLFIEISQRLPNDYRGWWGLVCAKTEMFQKMLFELDDFGDIVQNYTYAVNVAPNDHKNEITKQWNEYIIKRNEYLIKSKEEKEKRLEEAEKTKTELSAKIEHLKEEEASLSRKHEHNSKIITDTKAKKNYISIGSILLLFSYIISFVLWGLLALLAFCEIGFALKLINAGKAVSLFALYVPLIIFAISMTAYIIKTVKNKRNIGKLSQQNEEIRNRLTTLKDTIDNYRSTCEATENKRKEIEEINSQIHQLENIA